MKKNKLSSKIFIGVCALIGMFFLIQFCASCSDNIYNVELEELTLSADIDIAVVNEKILLEINFSPDDADYFPTSNGGKYQLKTAESGYNGLHMNYEFIDNDIGATVSDFFGEVERLSTFSVTSNRSGECSLNVYLYYAARFHSNEILMSSNTVTLTFVGKEIKTTEDLKAISLESDGSFVLANDIDLSDNWTPIGDFSGTLDGNGHAIKNLTIQSSNGANLGFIANNTGTIRNTVFENLNITATGNAGTIGGVAGTNSGIIKNCEVNGSITAAFYSDIGGIVGKNNKGRLLGNTNKAIIKGANSVGGIVGNSNVDGDERIMNNLNEADISGVDNVGGIAGYIANWGMLSDNTNEGTVRGEKNVGGIFGWYEGRDINNFINSGIVTGTKDNVGGLIGFVNSSGLITSSQNSANITGVNYVGGYVGRADNATIQVASNDNTITGRGYVGGIAGRAGKIENSINNGAIVSTAAIIESSVSNAYVGGIAGRCTDLIKCTNNSAISIPYNGQYVGGLVGYIQYFGGNAIIDNKNEANVSGVDYVGGIVGYVTGSSNGNVSGNMNSGEISGEGYIGGIFGRYSGGNISNFVNSGIITGTKDNVGGLIGFVDLGHLITSSQNSANVTGVNYVGGYVGRADNATIQVATNDSTITGRGYVGGIAGRAGKIENSINSGAVISTAAIVENGVSAAYLGGIAGRCTGLVKCTNNSVISIPYNGLHVGGLAGYVQYFGDNALIDNTNNAGVSGVDYVGGIAGYVTGSGTVSGNANGGAISGAANVGGIFGWYSGSNVGNFTNNGIVTGTKDNIGGLIGYVSSGSLIAASQNSANVTGFNYVGGYVGRADGVTIQVAVNNNQITGNGYVGGIAGRVGRVENSINNGTIISSAAIVEGGNNNAYVGGIAGYCTGIIRCTNNMAITVSHNGRYVGGLVGYIAASGDNVLNDNINNAQVSGADYVGGIAGHVQGGTNRVMSSNLNEGAVMGVFYVGGIFGYVNGGRVQNCTNNGNISGSGGYVGGIIGGYNNLDLNQSVMDTNITTSGNKLGQ